MTTTKQFWALLKFQTTVNPFVWIIPIILCAPVFMIGIFSGSYYPNLSSFLGFKISFLSASSPFGFSYLKSHWVGVPQEVREPNFF